MTQASATRRVLVCENRDKPGMGIAVELQKSALDKHFEIVTASGREAARGLLQAQSFACIVIDIGREGGDAPALVRAIGEGFSSLPLFVFNGFQIPGIAVKVQEYERIHYCEDPQDLDRFVALILEELSGKKKGTIEGILLANFIEWMGAEKLSGQVIVSNDKKKGVLYLQRGRLVGASTGDPRDRTALAEISSWKKSTLRSRKGWFKTLCLGQVRLLRRRRRRFLCVGQVPGSGEAAAAISRHFVSRGVARQSSCTSKSSSA